MDDHPWMIIMITSVAVRIAEGGSKGGVRGGRDPPPGFAIADSSGFFIPDPLLSGLYGSWSRKYDPRMADQGTNAARRARMRAEGTWVGRTMEPASLGRRKKKIKSLRDLICFVCIFFLKLGTALSNVRRDGVI